MIVRVIKDTQVTDGWLALTLMNARKEFMHVTIMPHVATELARICANVIQATLAMELSVMICKSVNMAMNVMLMLLAMRLKGLTFVFVTKGTLAMAGTARVRNMALQLSD